MMLMLKGSNNCIDMRPTIGVDKPAQNYVGR